VESRRLPDISADWTPDLICAEVARFFRVKLTEVALLRLEGNWLSFLSPTALRKIGGIHRTSCAVAAHTAQTGKAELFNNFTQVPHLSVYELIVLDWAKYPAPIQKLMSAPVFTPEGQTWGVIQVSRKASELQFAGSDFTAADLENLQLVAAVIGKSAHPASL
jgi:hypothetical protein